MTKQQQFALEVANFYANRYGKEINARGCTKAAKLYNKLRTRYYNIAMGN